MPPTPDQNVFTTIGSDNNSKTANSTSTTINFIGGTGITTDVAGDNFTITNSRFVKKKIIKTFSPFQSKIFALPFLPFQEKDFFFKKRDEIKKKYNIKDDFFFISNKFWKHKNHIVAFKAFEKLIKYKPNFCLVCTGETYDSRFPDHFKNLSKKFRKLINKGYIKILNVIPKNDQINLIRCSLGLIQPTLYEGGPGGFSGGNISEIPRVKTSMKVPDEYYSRYLRENVPKGDWTENEKSLVAKHE